MAKLKVFRTPIGFHDAYVAAPSRKAALKAWGAERDLFARGVAEEVTDAALMEAPLATPGEVIRVSRGSADEQLAALPDAKPSEPKPKSTSNPKAEPKPKPKPSRARLAAAEDAFADLQKRHEAEQAAFMEEEAALERRRRAMKKAQDAEAAQLSRKLAAAKEAYRSAMEAWREA